MKFGVDLGRAEREGGRARAPCSFLHRRFGRVFGALLIGAGAGVALASCGLTDGPGTFIVDPGRYAASHCKELVTQWKQLRTREQELRGLMDKASEGSGGAVIGALAYRTDYETVISEEKLLQRTAAEKK